MIVATPDLEPAIAAKADPVSVKADSADLVAPITANADLATMIAATAIAVTVDSLLFAITATAEKCSALPTTVCNVHPTMKPC